MSNEYYIRPLNAKARAHVFQQYEASLGVLNDPYCQGQGRLAAGKHLNDLFMAATTTDAKMEAMRARLKPEHIALYNEIVTGVLTGNTASFTPFMVIDLIREMELVSDWFAKRRFHESFVQQFSSKYGIGIIVEDILRKGVKTAPNPDDDTVMRIVYNYDHGIVSATAYEVMGWRCSEWVKDIGEFDFQDLSGIGGNGTSDFTQAEKYLEIETKYDGTAWLKTNDAFAHDLGHFKLFQFTMDRMYRRCGQLTDNSSFEYK